MPEVIIIGAGLSGLCCALELTKRGISWQILEASDRVGGRVATDDVDGFKLDRGFQVLLDAYPELRRVLGDDGLAALDLRRFRAGAALRLPDDTFTSVMNPLLAPSHAVSTLLAPIGSLADKLRILRLWSRVVMGSLDDIFARPETTTLKALQELGFSQMMIERFFTPFFGGIFLDRSLQTSSRMFEFVFRMFSIGSATVPAQGMAALPAQIAKKLDRNQIRLHAAAASLQTSSTNASVTLASGEMLAAKAVVVATDWNAASVLVSTASLLSAERAETPATALAIPLAIPESCSTACLYFAVQGEPSSQFLRQALLVLNSTGTRLANTGLANTGLANTGLVNNCCSMSAVSRSYAPAGQNLISVSTVGIPAMPDAELLAAVRAELKMWFGSEVEQWRHLRTYRIPHALPSQAAPALAQVERAVRFAPRLYVCGDHRDTASIQGAMVSGRRAAAEIAETMK